MLRRISIVAFSALFAVACSESGPPTTLSFKPEDGEKRRYQMYSDTKISAESRYGNRSERLEMMTLMDYEVSESSNIYSIRMTPLYMQMKFPQGGYRSFEKPSRGGPDDDIRAMMEAGFTVDIDKDSNEMLDFIVHEEPEDFRSKGFDPVKEILNDEFGRPGFVSGLKIKKGAEQVIEMESPLPAVTVRIEDFTNSTVTLSASGENDEAKVFGYVVMERESGWTERLTMVIDMPLPKEAAASSGSMRMVTSIYPEDWMFGQDLEFLRRADPISMSNTDFSEEAPDDDATDAEVFANNAGKILFYDGRMTLSYSHPGVDFERLGSIKIKDVQVKGKDGETLDVDMHYNGALTYTAMTNNNATTVTDLYPLGWKNVVDDLEQMVSVEATLERYVATHEVIDFPIDKEGSSIAMEGAKATLVPTGDERVFELKLTSTETAYFNTQVNGVSGASLKYDKDTKAPSWISDGESRALAVTKAGNYPVTLQLTFMDELPDSIELKFSHFTDEKLSEKTIVFYDEETLKGDTTIAPIDNIPLFKSEQNRDYYVNDQALEFNTSTLDKLEPTSFGRPQLYLTLTPEQANVCRLQTDVDATESGAELRMKENRDPNRRYVDASLQMPRKVVYQLMTDDGVQRYFYDKTVSLELSCDGKPVWQPLDIALNEKDWMVPVEDLLGESWEENQSDIPMSEVLREYRFLDASGQALAVLPKDGSRHSVDYFERSVSEFVSNDGLLRIGGRVERIEQLVVEGDPFTKEWSHQLPAMPDFESLQEAN
ncbi:hypothetical protein [Idiomarina ramblicola]|uniref:Lipoprotein n=1 Tax=Idiomarina ramblicola TaxID=263724 RepID=A0A432Z5U6_9GAMM|nr:hypothetical protein [Idiomarina ramblicola]RUO73264.1 hypothetical protein CWI78_02115 [Idiomarina ramblicola]